MPSFLFELLAEAAKRYSQALRELVDNPNAGEPESQNHLAAAMNLFCLLNALEVHRYPDRGDYFNADVDWKEYRKVFALCLAAKDQQQAELSGVLAAPAALITVRSYNKRTEHFHHCVCELALFVNENFKHSNIPGGSS